MRLTRRRLLAQVKVLLARTGATETRKNLRERVARTAKEAADLKALSAKLERECKTLRAQLTEALSRACPVIDEGVPYTVTRLHDEYTWEKTAATPHGAGAGALNEKGGISNGQEENRTQAA